MTLNCLACQPLQRTDSDKDITNIKRENKELHSRKLCCLKGERSWSGNLGSPPYEQMRINPSSQSMQLVLPANKKVKKSCRRLMSSASTVAVLPYEGQTEPKLVRSVGMRRDWSFEDLRKRNENRQSGRLA